MINMWNVLNPEHDSIIVTVIGGHEHYHLYRGFLAFRPVETLYTAAMCSRSRRELGTKCRKAKG